MIKRVSKSFILRSSYIEKIRILSRRNVSSILGIETSCDDTGCGIVNSHGELLSESISSQNLVHLRHGGIIPDVAQDLHKTVIKQTVNNCLKKANLTMNDISAVAVTVKPGLILSLSVGLRYAKLLARKYNKPIIPIHHMKAHALIARMNNDISFPFLTLLISGGHCLLAIANDVDNFQILGQSIDTAPGEILDKVARAMKLKNIPEYSQLCGGEAVERAATHSMNYNVFNLPLPLANQNDCNFSFNGLKTSVIYTLMKKESEHNIVGDKLIPETSDLCAATLKAVSRHLVHRTIRAMEFCEIKNLIPNEKKQLVVSGGVACNNYIYRALSMICDEYGYDIYRPKPNLCTDNGVMIAWNGLEKWKKGIDIVTDINSLEVEASTPIGESLIEEVMKSNLSVKLKKIKLC